ncbi:polyketide synthase dehydratase domain-containing protein, partial [Burkholderia pseudomallei]
AACFGATLAGDEPFLRDHRIDGRPVMPSSAYLEMVREAAARALGEPADAMLVIEGIAWRNPLTVSGGARRLQLRAQAEPGARALRFDVSSQAAG